MTATSSPALLTREQELASIIGAYNEVTEQLRLSHEHLQQQVGKLREELADKNAQLARSERLAALGQMAAGLAHEIRNPLGGIALFASLLERDLGHLPEQRALAQRISRGVGVLDGLVKDILDCAGEVPLQLAEVDPAELVVQSLELLAPLINEKQPEITTELPEDTVIIADATQLRSALLNLLRNAVEAGEAGGEICISVGRAPGREAVQISIADRGPGIPPEHLDKIFNPFFTTKETGTGLGLSQVHRMVDAHGGRIKVENRPSGGACFRIELPRRAAAQDEEAQKEAPS